MKYFIALLLINHVINHTIIISVNQYEELINNDLKRFLEVKRVMFFINNIFVGIKRKMHTLVIISVLQ